MRKSRFLCMLCVLLLLLFCIVASGCQGEEPPAESPFVIEQGEITVSEYWQSASPAVNPIPSDVQGSALPYEELGFYVVESLSEPGEERPMQAADSLTEAAALVRQSGVLSREQEQIDRLCQKLGRVDFSQFRLLVLYDQFKEDLVDNYRFYALIHNGTGKLTRLYEYTPTIFICRCNIQSVCARFLLVRRADYNVAQDQMQGNSISYRPPIAIEPGEITVSDYWKNDPVAVNPRPERVEGTPLCFEEIAYVGADMSSVESSTKRFFIADDLSGASELIRNYAAYKNVAGSGFDTVCEAVSHVDFSQFRLLLFLEVYGSGSLTHHYVMEGLVHDGEGKLTKMMLDPADPGWINHMMAYMARFVLVRRADYEAESEAAQGINHYYRPYPDPIEPGEINVSPYWQNATPAENPCPDVAGSSICFEELGCYYVYDSFWLKKPATLYCVTDLADAATLIDGYVYDHGEDDVVALREKASQIDFSQFYLLVVIDHYVYDQRYFVPKALVHDGNGNLTLVTYEDEALRPSYATPGEYVYARFVLVRRADYTASDNANFINHIYADPPNVIEQGEITVSEHWDVIEHPINYYKHFCNAPALQFEQLGLVAVEYNGRKRIAFADDIAEAAALIDSITTYNSAGCLALNEIASHVDFSQFRLLLIEENWYNTNRIDNCYLDTIIYKDKNLHTVYGYYGNSSPDPGSGSVMRYVRVILIHRSQLSEDPEFYQRHD